MNDVDKVTEKVYYYDHPAAYNQGNNAAMAAMYTAMVKADKYYKCKLAFITIDEKTAKEKRSNVYYLVQAENIDKAKANIDEAMRGTMIDYEVLSVVETKILDVLCYGESEDVDAKETSAAQYMLAGVKTKPSAKAIKAFKGFEDSIPKGQKVSISTTERDGMPPCKIVEIDKTTRKEIPKNE